MHVVYALSHVCGQDRTLLAGILLKIFLHEKLESLLLRTLNDREISMEGTVLIILTLAETLGREWLPCLHFCLLSLLHHISNCEHSLFFPSAFCCLIFPILHFIFFRWSYYFVSCHHFSKYTYGAIYESHSNTFCSSCTERQYIKDNGEQAVLWGDNLNYVF